MHHYTLIAKLKRCDVISLRLLPSWQKLYGNSPHPTEDESKLVMEESELLMSNLGREPLRRLNVLLDHDLFKLLGILQESLVSW